MWDLFTLRAMNEEADRQAGERRRGGVRRIETLFGIGSHRTVEVKHYADGHSLFTCEENRCQALTEEDLAVRPCQTVKKRPAGWV